MHEGVVDLAGSSATKTKRARKILTTPVKKVRVTPLRPSMTVSDLNSSQVHRSSLSLGINVTYS